MKKTDSIQQVQVKQMNFIFQDIKNTDNTMNTLLLLLYYQLFDPPSSIHGKCQEILCSHKIYLPNESNHILIFKPPT